MLQTTEQSLRSKLAFIQNYAYTDYMINTTQFLFNWVTFVLLLPEKSQVLSYTASFPVIFSLERNNQWTGEMAQWLEGLLLLKKTQNDSQHIHGGA